MCVCIGRVYTHRRTVSLQNPESHTQHTSIRKTRRSFSGNNNFRQPKAPEYSRSGNRRTTAFIPCSNGVCRYMCVLSLCILSVKLERHRRSVKASSKDTEAFSAIREITVQTNRKIRFFSFLLDRNLNLQWLQWWPDTITEAVSMQSQISDFY